MKICLDAGHYGYYNRSPANSNYYESLKMWDLHLLVKKELENYGIETVLTRSDQKKDLSLSNRGQMAKGCNLFISFHSNSTGSSGVNESVDYPVSFVSVDGYADAIGLRLAKVVENTIPTMQEGRIYKKYSESRPGQNYYGVLSSASAFGVTALILECSFHTNTRATEWLMSYSNLEKLAKNLAAEIASYYVIPLIKKSGWIQDEKGWSYYHEDESKVANDWLFTDKWYWFDREGYMVSNQWYNQSDKWYYFGPDGAMLTDQWLLLEDKLYRLGENGAMLTDNLYLTSCKDGSYMI